jgi:hypothetical protein
VTRDTLTGKWGSSLRIEIEQFSSGWSGLRIMMTNQEAKAMRELLLSLEAEEIGHFHAYSLD